MDTQDQSTVDQHIPRELPPTTGTALRVRGLRSRNAADYLGVSEEFLRKARQGKTKVKGPPYRKLGERIVIYTIEDLDAYIDESVQAA